MTLRSCREREHLYAIAWVDVVEPTEIDAAMRALAAAARDNVSADATQTLPLAVAGSTPQLAAGRWQWKGRLPDGRGVQQQGAVFSRGTRVYQASVTAASIDAASADHYFASFGWRP